MHTIETVISALRLRYRRSFKKNASEAVCIFVKATAALFFFFIITEARANSAKPLRLLL
jgi:hypothetical protein